MKKLLGPVTLLAAGAVLGWCGASSRAGDDDAKLPDAVKAAVAKAYPGFGVEDSDLDLVGKVVYAISLEKGDENVTLQVAPDGTIVQVETNAKDPPAPVTKAFAASAGAGKVEDVVRVERRAAAQIVALPAPVVFYEGTITKGEESRQARFNADGSVAPKDEGDVEDDVHADGPGH